MANSSNNFSDMKPLEKAGVILMFFFWICVGVLFLVYNSNENKRKAEYERAYATVEKQCENKRISSDDYSPEAAYDLYHDNGSQNPPVCRQPENQDEVDQVVERRRYRQQLENGDVDPPSLDENCYTASVCQ